ncbi:AAA family ATPase [Actinomyces qiguomingii]|uniref:AAA family ATPase n=1 Tax=Actinomyces qiguomingii TaxID=2057800 RepID=UPI0013047D48|nr:AAA family ATPase [Actinomyces qiguomingii]
MTGAVLVLLAGLPGTGKTHLCSRIRACFPNCTQVSIDVVKEALWERYGFDDAAQKRELDDMALRLFFSDLDTALGHAHDSAAMVVSDYPFSDKQEPTLRALCERHRATVMTIRLTADLEVLFERQQRRDLDPSRHLGHIVDHYHRGDTLKDRTAATGLLTREEFYRRCTTRGYDAFRLGDLLEVDATDLDAVDHEAILKWIAARSE